MVGSVRPFLKIAFQISTIVVLDSLAWDPFRAYFLNLRFSKYRSHSIDLISDQLGGKYMYMYGSHGEHRLLFWGELQNIKIFLITTRWGKLQHTSSRVCMRFQ